MERFNDKFIDTYFRLLNFLDSKNIIGFNKEIIEDPNYFKSFLKKDVIVSFKTSSLKDISKIGIYNFNYNLISSVLFVEDNFQLNFKESLNERFVYFEVDCEEIESVVQINKEMDHLYIDNYKNPFYNKKLISERYKTAIKTADLERTIPIIDVHILELLQMFELNNLENMGDSFFRDKHLDKLKYKNMVPGIIKILKEFEEKEIFAIFRFKQVLWFELLFAFSRYNLYISGGNPVKRHLLNQNDFILSSFLIKFSNNKEVDLVKEINKNTLPFLVKHNFQISKLPIFFRDKDKIKDLNTINSEKNPKAKVLISIYYFSNYVVFLKRRFLEYLEVKEEFLIDTFRNIIIPEEFLLNKYKISNFSDVFKTFFILGEDELLINNINYVRIRETMELIEKIEYVFYHKNSIKFKIFKDNKCEEKLLYILYEYKTSLYKLAKFVYYFNYLEYIEGKGNKKPKKKIIKASNKEISNLINNSSGINIINMPFVKNKKFKRDYHSYPSAFIEEKDALELTNNISKYKLELEDINSIEPFNKFMENYNNNSKINAINNILFLENMETKTKQREIERILQNFVRDKVLKLLGKNINKRKYGINLIISMINLLDRDLTDLKNNKRQLSNKVYMKYILNLENDLIISLVLSYVIPFCLNKNKYTLTTLFEKIGKAIYIENFQPFWFYYKNNIKKTNGKDYSIEIDLIQKKYKTPLFLNKEDFINNIIENNLDVYPILTKDQFFLLGIDIVEFFSKKSEFFKLSNEAKDKDKIYRVLLPDVGFNEFLLNIFNNDLDKLPMICTPSE